MTARIIDGKAAAAEIRQRVAAAAAQFQSQVGRAPGLATVLVGEDPASAVYVRSKAKATAEAGMESFSHQLPADTSEADLLELVELLNAGDGVDGILVQLPLPGHIDSAKVIAAIDPAKDVDGFNPVNAGRLAIGLDALVPCTPLGCLYLLKQELGSLSGKDAVVIDVGINRVSGAEEGKTRLVGDVAFAEAAEIAAAITPVPGGVGPMTIAMLLRNTVVAAHRREGLPDPEDL